MISCMYVSYMLCLYIWYKGLQISKKGALVYVAMRACARARVCVRVRVRVRVCACVFVRGRVCACVCVCVRARVRAWPRVYCARAGAARA